MTEVEWLESTHLFGLLDYARRRVSGRRLCSYALFWVDQTLHLLTDATRRGVEQYRARAAEPGRVIEHTWYAYSPGFSTSFTHGSAANHAEDAAQALQFNDWTTAALVAGRAVAQDRVYGPRTPASARSVYDLRFRFWEVAEHVVREQVFSLRCAAGNPFHAHTCDPEWLTPTAIALARAGDSGDASVLPILADALQDAGCEDGTILDHLRGAGPHLSCCWCSALILGKG